MDATNRNGSRARSRSTLCVRALLVLVACLAWLAPLPLRAQQVPQPKVAAEALFNEGQKLLFERDYEAACRRFEQSQSLDPGVGTLLYLGECYERLGRPASAWATYREAESSARAAGQWDRNRVAHDRAMRLEPTLSKLTVSVAAQNPREGLEVTLNGKLLDAALYGNPVPIDPGRYELVARALGRTPWSSTIEVAPGQGRAVEVPVLQPAKAEPLAAADPYASSSGAAPADTGSALSPRQRTSIIVAAGGVAALATGVVLGLVAQGKDDEAKESCANGCTDPGRSEDLNESARNWATGANIAYGLGAAALVTGGVLYFWPEKKSSATSGRRAPLDISAQLGPKGGLLMVGGVL